MFGIATDAETNVIIFLLKCSAHLRFHKNLFHIFIGLNSRDLHTRLLIIIFCLWATIKRVSIIPNKKKC